MGTTPTNFARIVSEADAELQRAVLAPSPGVAMVHLNAAVAKVQEAYRAASEASFLARNRAERADLEASWQ